jgi:hypothetical protein
MRATISLLRNGFEEERVFRQAARVRCGSMLSKKSKIEGLRKSRKGQVLVVSIQTSRP